MFQKTMQETACSCKHMPHTEYKQGCIEDTEVGVSISLPYTLELSRDPCCVWTKLY